MPADSLRDRLHNAVCDCGAVDGDCARGNDALNVVADWLRDQAGQWRPHDRASYGVTPHYTARDVLNAQAAILDRLADSLGARSIAESTEEPDETR